MRIRLSDLPPPRQCGRILSGKGGDFLRLKDYSRFDDPEEEFMLDYPFAWSLLQYVESIRGENRWFLKNCTEFDSGRCSVEFCSYAVHEYEKFQLIVRATPTASGWDFSVVSQNTELS